MVFYPPPPASADISQLLDLRIDVGLTNLASGALQSEVWFGSALRDYRCIDIPGPQSALHTLNMMFTEWEPGPHEYRVFNRFRPNSPCPLTDSNVTDTVVINDYIVSWADPARPYELFNSELGPGEIVFREGDSDDLSVRVTLADPVEGSSAPATVRVFYDVSHLYPGGLGSNYVTKSIDEGVVRLAFPETLNLDYQNTQMWWHPDEGTSERIYVNESGEALAEAALLIMEQIVSVAYEPVGMLFDVLDFASSWRCLEEQGNPLPTAVTGFAHHDSYDSVTAFWQPRPEPGVVEVIFPADSTVQEIQQLLLDDPMSLHTTYDVSTCTYYPYEPPQLSCSTIEHELVADSLGGIRDPFVTPPASPWVGDDISLINTESGWYGGGVVDGLGVEYIGNEVQVVARITDPPATLSNVSSAIEIRLSSLDSQYFFDDGLISVALPESIDAEGVYRRAYGRFRGPQDPGYLFLGETDDCGMTMVALGAIPLADWAVLGFRLGGLMDGADEPLPALTSTELAWDASHDLTGAGWEVYVDWQLYDVVVTIPLRQSKAEVQAEIEHHGIAIHLNPVLHYYDGIFCGLSNCEREFEVVIGHVNGMGQPRTVSLNEVDPGTPDAIEFYNFGSQPVDMTGWQFQNYREDGTLYTTYTFPSFTLPPGSYVVLEEYGDPANNTSTELYTGGNISWVVAAGAAALLDDLGSGVDFMQWGAVDVPPPAGTGWTGTNPTPPSSGQNLGRDAASTDTDDGGDWCAQTPSLGAQNNDCAPVCYLLSRDCIGSGSLPIASPTNSSGCPGDQYIAEELINLTASPDPGWHVAGWSGTNDDASTSTANQLTMPASDHTVTVHYEEDTPTTGDSYEPDNTWDLANWIEDGASQRHSIEPVGDEDWVKFSLDAESEIVLETSGAGYDTRMWLYDSSLNELEYDDDDGWGRFSFIDRVCGVDALPAGTYYVKINDFGSNSEIPRYDIEFTVVQPCEGEVGPLVYDSHIIDDDTLTSNGDNDGIVDCGETIELNVILRNQGTVVATDVVAGLSAADSYISITDAEEDFPDIAGGGTGEDLADYDFVVDAGTPDGHIIHFDLDITASNGGPWSDSFDIPVSCGGNSPPYEPSDPTPADGEVGVSVATDLSWAGGDPDVGDTVTYDVYFGTTSPPTTVICDDVTATTCDPGTLSYDTPYYWYVVATDGDGVSTAGLLWDFATSTTAIGDSYEPDNTWDLANWIEDGASQRHSIEPVGDEDWVKFSLDAESEIVLETSGAGYDTRMWLYDSSLNELEYDDDDGWGRFSFIDRVCGVDALPAGTYYVKINDFGSNSEIPRYDIEFTVVQPCEGEVGPLVYDSHIIDDDTLTSNGDNDGIVDCGETIELNVILRNQGTVVATDVVAGLSAADSYISITDAEEDFPDIAGGGTGEDLADYDFVVDAGTPDGHIIHFDLDITASNGGPWSDSFDIPVSCGGNSPPYEPSDPTPADGEVGVSVATDLSWAGGDPDVGDTVTYDVYFGTTSPPTTVICDDVSTTTCDPGTLSYNTSYYWYVVATDGDGDSTTGLLWDFATSTTASGDSYEPDDTWEQASWIYDGVSQTHSIEPEGDVDWLKFTVAVDSEIVLETSGAPGDTVMWLYDSGLNELEYDDDDGWVHFSLIDRVCGVDALPAGTYYVKVDEYHSDDEIARYEIAFTLVQTCAGDLSLSSRKPKGR